MGNPNRQARAEDSTPGGRVVEINFRPAPAPDPDDHRRREYNDGDPVPDGWYVFDPDPDRPGDPKYLLYDWPYEETTCGRLDALEDAVRTLRRKLAVAEHQAGAR